MVENVHMPTAPFGVIGADGVEGRRVRGAVGNSDDVACSTVVGYGDGADDVAVGVLPSGGFAVAAQQVVCADAEQSECEQEDYRELQGPLLCF